MFRNSSICVIALFAEVTPEGHFRRCRGSTSVTSIFCDDRVIYLPAELAVFQLHARSDISARPCFRCASRPPYQSRSCFGMALLKLDAGAVLTPRRTRRATAEDKGTS